MVRERAGLKVSMECTVRFIGDVDQASQMNMSQIVLTERSSNWSE